jgi:Protein of unknown function (DUF2817)
MSVKTAYIAFAAACALAYAAYRHRSKDYSFAEIKGLLVGTKTDDQVLNLFSEDYYMARALFRKMCKKVSGLLTYSINIYPDEEFDHTIDVAVLRRSIRSMIIHVSGTHGVEGFAGSAVQSALLSELGTAEELTDMSRPTIVFIHALNPFGFARLRRWNENGVVC